MSRTSLILVLLVFTIVGCGNDHDSVGEADQALADSSQEPGNTLSIEDAVDQASEHIGAPVKVPSTLPEGAYVAGKGLYLSNRGGPNAQIHLAFPSGENLVLQYGVARFDGCGPLEYHAVTVGGEQGIASTSTGSSNVTTIVWPATEKFLQGQFGISGTLPEERLLQMANSMESDLAGATKANRPGC